MSRFGESLDYRHAWQIRDWLREEFGIAPDSVPVEVYRDASSRAPSQLTFHRSQQPPRSVFAMLVGDSPLPRFMPALFPAAAAQLSHCHNLQDLNWRMPVIWAQKLSIIFQARLLSSGRPLLLYLGQFTPCS